jgi:gliding motility-associated-like protein
LSVCPGVTGVYYWVTNPNPNSTYQWIINSGTVASGQGTDTITVDWSAVSGPASVTVIETTDLGCQSEPVVLPVTINVFLTPVAPTGPLTFCANAASGTYTALSTTGSTYNWFAQGGVIVSGNGTNTVTVNWTAQGPVTVYLWYEETSTTAVDTCFGTSDTLAININPAPITGAISGPPSVCVDGTGTFSVVNTASSTYQWFISGGTILSGNGTNSVTASWTGSGTAVVSVVETNSLGCLGDTVTYNITVNPLPAANAGPDVSVCQGLGVQLNATGGVTYSWSPTTGLSNPNIANPVATPGTAISYIVLVTDANGCSNTDTVDVSVNSLPVVTVSPNTAICIGGSTQLQAGGGASFQWSPAGSLNNPSVPDPIASPQATTVYTVVATNGIGCSDSAQVTVTVNPLPVATASADTVICAGTSASLAAGGGVSYSWSPATGLSNTGIQNPVATPQASITYTVIVTDVNGCSDDEQVSISLNDNPEAAFTVGEDVSGISCSGYTATLINQSSNANGYEWYFADGSTSTDENPQHQFVFDGSNQVILVALNNMCRDTAIQEITHTSVTAILENTPKVFSPNSDGKNDCFELALDFDDCSDWSVYNRWGTKVFQSSPSSPCWNGKKDNNGEELPTGTYYLVVKVFDGKYNGTVTLIR